MLCEPLAFRTVRIDGSKNSGSASSVRARAMCASSASLAVYPSGRTARATAAARSPSFKLVPPDPSRRGFTLNLAPPLRSYLQQQPLDTAHRATASTSYPSAALFSKQLQSLRFCMSDRAPRDIWNHSSGSLRRPWHSSAFGASFTPYPTPRRGSVHTVALGTRSPFL